MKAACGRCTEKGVEVTDFTVLLHTSFWKGVLGVGWELQRAHKVCVGRGGGGSKAIISATSSSGEARALVLGHLGWVSGSCGNVPYLRQ